MTYLDVFTTAEQGEDNIPLHAYISNLDRDQSLPVPFKVENALQKFSASTIDSDALFSRAQYTWDRMNAGDVTEPQPPPPPPAGTMNFSNSLTGLFLEDHDLGRGQLDAAYPVYGGKGTEEDAHALSLGQVESSSPIESLDSQQMSMSLSPTSIVDLSEQTSIRARNPYCIIRSSHSATAAAAAATAAMIINDEPRVGLSRRCSSLFPTSSPPSPSAKRPRILSIDDAPYVLSTEGSLSSENEDSLLPDTPDGLNIAENALSQVSEVTNSHKRLLSEGKRSVMIERAADTSKQSSNAQTRAITPFHFGTKNNAQGVSDSSAKLSVSERARQCRAEALIRFRRKKAIRCFGRRVRYECRKRIATTRPRVNGRFAKKSDVVLQKTPT